MWARATQQQTFFRTVYRSPGRTLQGDLDMSLCEERPLPVEVSVAAEPAVVQSCRQVTTCLKHLWTDPGPASRVFLATNCVNQHLLASASLALAMMETTNDVSGRVMFGAARTVAALGVPHLAKLDMILVLESGGGLALYSGAVKISLLPSPPSPSLHHLALIQVLVPVHWDNL